MYSWPEAQEDWISVLSPEQRSSITDLIAQYGKLLPSVETWSGCIPPVLELTVETLCQALKNFPKLKRIQMCFVYSLGGPAVIEESVVELATRCVSLEMVDVIITDEVYGQSIADGKFQSFVVERSQANVAKGRF